MSDNYKGVVDREPTELEFLELEKDCWNNALAYWYNLVSTKGEEESGVVPRFTKMLSQPTFKPFRATFLQWLEYQRGPYATRITYSAKDVLRFVRYHINELEIEIDNIHKS